MNIHKPSLKLASLYLLILMAISVFFSAIIYQSYLTELTRSLHRPIPALEQRGRGFDNELFNDIRSRIAQERTQQYRDAREHIIKRLIVTNILILMGGGILSYYLALRTLRPIEEAHDALERFTADASHELRTPLAVIKTENEVALMDTKLTITEAKHLLQSNVEELDKLTGLIEGLLRLARTDRIAAVSTAVSVRSIIDETTRRLKSYAELNEITLRVAADDVSVLGDQLSLVEALVTITENAIKYSTSKSTVTIEAHQKSNGVSIAVSDTGPGISQTDLPHIFERFYRADSARARQDSGGYGLGLAIAKTIIEAHGGTVAAQSDVGKGTTFTINLPRTK